MAKETFYVLVANTSGDTRFMITWDPENEKDREEVKAKFEEMRKAGYIFYECEGFEGEYKPVGQAVKNLDSTKGRLVAEKYFDGLESAQKEEVVLTDITKRAEGQEMVDLTEDKPKNGATYGATEMVKGG